MDETYSDEELRNRALVMWANYIETGNVGISAVDAQKMISAGVNSSMSFRSEKVKINALDENQMDLVLRLRKLAKMELQPRKTTRP